MKDLDDILKSRPDLEALVALGIEAVIRHLLVIERELAEARRKKTPVGDSRTTHAPPSTDPRPKPRSQRRKTGKKTGGQPGHPGHRLEPVKKPDSVVIHTVAACSDCGHHLDKTKVTNTTSHQVFELPKIELFVTDHRCESKICPKCTATTTAAPPSGAEQPTQYGSRLVAFATYLHVGQFIPLERTADLIEVITGARVSEGWISSCQDRVSAQLNPFMKAITAALRAAKVICCDESGFRFAGKRHWLHVCCTAFFTLLMCHRKRGDEGTSALGVLPGYTNTAIHDHWSTYFKYTKCNHGVCNEHHARELNSVTDRDGQPWAEAMKIVLYDGLELKRKYHDKKIKIPPEEIRIIIARYNACLRDGFAANPEPPPSAIPKRGRLKRGKTLSLLHRLRDRKTETLLFLHDPAIPWSNNQAERDIRPMKIQQKVSGGSRTEKGAVRFCRIRSYLSTTSKNGIHPFDAIVSALAGNPWLPKVTELLVVKSIRKKAKAA